LAALLAYRNRLLREVAGAARHLLAPTDFVRDWYAGHGVTADRIVVLPPALEDPPDLERQQAPGKLRVGYIGGLSWQKGVHVLVEALADLEDRAELWIAGDESADAAYASRLRALATPAVRFLGRLDRAQVWRMLSQLDIVAVPTLWYETFSFIISEAFGMGLPVMASKLGPLADRVHDGVDGFLLPPGDVSAWRAALWRLVDEPRLLERLRVQVRPPPTLEDHILRLESIYGTPIADQRQVGYLC
jgi:glycosyltransferase involved in cell wall biosynthesis